jgi:transcriptional regulator with XRE-family HTH domain
VEDPEDVVKALGYAVRELRVARDMSQEDLAFRTGVHRNYIGGIERGERRPTIPMIVKLAAGLDVRFSELIAHADRYRP